ncbi:MAG: hypothetical protein GY771_09850 [bacterium]|nr:hypothetical protein [bacterium]
MPSARQLAFTVLKETAAGAKLDDALNRVLSGDSGLERRDERFLLQLVKTTLRNQTLLDYQIERSADRPTGEIDADILVLLRMGILQLHLLETAEYAAVNETVKLAKLVIGKKESGFVNAVMRSSIREGLLYPDQNVRESDPVEYLRIKYSHPSWLVERWYERFGAEETEELLRINNEPAPLTALTSPDFEGPVSGDGSSDSLFSDGPLGTLIVELGSRLSDFAPFTEGKLLIVDPSSTLGVAALSPPMGAVVGDFAAGVGGKTVQLSWKVGGEGTVIAIDNDKGRIRVLKSNLKKHRLGNVSPILADIARCGVGGLDYILLDVPCSNSGVLRRKPDVRWRLRPEDIEDTAEGQKKLLKSSWEALNAGGLLVYETCSMEPEENEAVIAWAESELGAVVEDAVAKLESPLREALGPGPFVNTYPHKHQCNGAFIAALRRE